MEFPGEKLVLKMWETVAEKGIASLLRPWQIRREGLAFAEVKRQELLLLAQATEDVKRISERQATYSQANGLRIAYEPSTSTPAETREANEVDHAHDSLMKEQLRKDINLTKALGYAEQVLSDDTSEPSTEKVDDDWLYRWRDCASDISNESLQALWGRLIANEIKSPGSYSLRTLEFLKNISSREALLSSKALRFAFGETLFVPPKEKLEKYGLQFTELLEVQSLGLISGVDSLGLKYTMKSGSQTEFKNYIFYHDLAIEIDHEDPKKIVEIPAYIVTPLGMQIMALAPLQPDQNYFQDLAKHIKDAGFKVRIGSAIHVGFGRYQLRNMQPLEG